MTLLPEYKEPLLDVDYLRAHCTKIHFFGLGFVQMKMDDDTRYHFYHPFWSKSLWGIKAVAENPHDHRYHFTSHVLRGTLRTHVWKIVPNVIPDSREGALPAVLRYDSCTPGVAAPDEKRYVMALKVSTFDVSAGSSYYLDENTYHQVEVCGDEPCVTHLVRGPKVKPFASILALPGKEDQCPFSCNQEEYELWDVVDACCAL